MPTGRIASLTLIAGFIALLAGGCGGGSSGRATAYPLSVTRLKTLDRGLLLYMGDWDERLPLGNSWMEGLTPYVHDPEAFHSPALEDSHFGYALNSAVAGHTFTEFSDPASVVTFFDSRVVKADATASLDTMPTPPRYITRNTIAYLDGHVQDEITDQTPPADLYQESRTRLKRVALGMAMYGSDYDDRLPFAGKWMDQLSPYVTTANSFRSPAVELANPANYGFALNQGIASHSFAEFDNPATMISIFDSTLLNRNATGPTTTVPSPPRYGLNNTIAYLDGHVP